MQDAVLRVVQKGLPEGPQLQHCAEGFREDYESLRSPILILISSNGKLRLHKHNLT